MNVIINPGTGPVLGATRRNADKNMRQFIRDMACGMVRWGRYGAIENGRYGYRLTRGDKAVDIDMPGLELDAVRYIHAPGQNPWHFPRLYVDGSSWMWMFAVSIALEVLGLEAQAQAYPSARLP